MRKFLLKNKEIRAVFLKSSEKGDTTIKLTLTKLLELPFRVLYRTRSQTYDPCQIVKSRYTVCISWPLRLVKIKQQNEIWNYLNKEEVKMEQIIAIAFIALLVFFVVKVGSVLWRIAGLLFLLFIIYIYKDQVISQVQQFVADPNFGELWQNISNFFGNLFDKVTGFVSTVIE